MKIFNKVRNVKNRVILSVKNNNKMEYVIKHLPSIKPKNKRAK